MKRTYYDWLEVAENASPEVIRGAFKYLAQKYHPDKKPEDPELAGLMLREITAAFNVLSDPTARANYDRWLKRQRWTNPDFERRQSRTSRRRPRKAKKANKDDPDSDSRGTSGKGVDTWA